MIMDRLTTHLDVARARMLAWPAGFTEEERARLGDPGVAEQVDRLAYLDGWRRIRRTTPMILAAIARFDERSDADSTAFWIEHLDEEHGHDRIMLDDLRRMYGDEAALTRALDANPISPASAALAGFFEWQVAHGDPHLLVVLRLLLEHIFATMEEPERARVDAGIPGNSQTLMLHNEADQAHVLACGDYLSAHFSEADVPTLIWALDYAALMLSDAQTWVAARVLGGSG